MVNNTLLVDRDAPITGATASEWIANRIAVRYANPARRAYLFLFQLRPDPDFMSIPPDLAQVVTSWIDEGSGLARSASEVTVARCRTLHTALHASNPIPKGKFITQQMMARIVEFSVTLIDAETDPAMSVDLFSRALAFTPKADRRVIERWKPTGEGWYSTYSGDDD